VYIMSVSRAFIYVGFLCFWENSFSSIGISSHEQVMLVNRYQYNRQSGTCSDDVQDEFLKTECPGMFLDLRIWK
jgi:hypothetical protein